MSFISDVTQSYSRTTITIVVLVCVIIVLGIVFLTAGISHHIKSEKERVERIDSLREQGKLLRLRKHNKKVEMALQTLKNADNRNREEASDKRDGPAQPVAQGAAAKSVSFYDPQTQTQTYSQAYSQAQPQTYSQAQPQTYSQAQSQLQPQPTSQLALQPYGSQQPYAAQQFAYDPAAGYAYAQQTPSHTYESAPQSYVVLQPQQPTQY